VIDYKRTRFEDVVPMVDIVLDMVGGDTRERSVGIIKPGGILVSVVSEPMPGSVFFLVEVTTERLEKITDFFGRGSNAVDRFAYVTTGIERFRVQPELVGLDLTGPDENACIF